MRKKKSIIMCDNSDKILKNSDVCVEMSKNKKCEMPAFIILSNLCRDEAISTQVLKTLEMPDLGEELSDFCLENRRKAAESRRNRNRNLIEGIFNILENFDGFTERMLQYIECRYVYRMVDVDIAADFCCSPSTLRRLHEKIYCIYKWHGLGSILEDFLNVAGVKNSLPVFISDGKGII